MFNSRAGALTILTVVLAVSLEVRGSSDTGISAYLQGSYGEAVPTLSHRAKRGFGPSQYYLGLVFLHGRGVGVDRALAYAWFAVGERNGHQPSRNARRRLHLLLDVGELPRAERLARKFIDRFSRAGYRPAPCYSNFGERIVKRCGPPPA